MATPNTTAGKPAASPPQRPRPQPQPQPRPQRPVRQSGGNTGLIVGLIVLFLIAVAVGLYAWMTNSELEEETAALRSKVKFLETRMDNTESAIVQITAGDEIMPSVRTSDGNIVINRKEAASQREALRANTPAKRAKTAAPRRTKSARANRPRYDSYTASPRFDEGRVPRRFGNTYHPPSSVRYAVLIDSFSERRHAEITKALFVMRYGTYIRRVGRRYNVYEGWYADVNDANNKLALLRQEYGPSCRIVALYN